MTRTTWTASAWVLAPLFTALGAACPAGTAVGQVLDQKQEWVTNDSYFTVGTNLSGTQVAIGQVFTAGMDGYLTRVEALLENDASHPVTLGVSASIMSVTADGLPSGRVLGSGSATLCPEGELTETCVPFGAPGWVKFSIQPIIVTAGTRYALTLRATGGGYLKWFDHIGPSAYPNGYMAGNTGAGWWKGGYDDMTFRTYVIPPELDQSQTVHNSWFAVQQNVDLGNWWDTAAVAQTFTTGMQGGYLHKLRLLLETGSTVNPVTVNLQGVSMQYDGAYPGATITSATIPVAKLPPAGSPAWVDVTLNDPVITPSTQYTIVLAMAGDGWIKWHDFHRYPYFSQPDVYPAGGELIAAGGRWWNLQQDYTLGPRDAAFETYILPFMTRSPTPPPRVITPCAGRVCPETVGSLTPADSTDGITAHFLFKERPNGTLQGILDIDDAAPGGLTLHGCTTESTACRLTVTTFLCTAPQTLTVAGSLKRPEDASATSFVLDAAGTQHGSGTFTLGIGRSTYSFMHDRMLNVTCPAVE